MLKLFSKSNIYILIDMFDSTYQNFYTPCKSYAFTINAHDRHQFFEHANRLKKGIAYYTEKLNNSLNDYADYVAYVELSEPKGELDVHSMGPRLHVHGVFILRSDILTRQFLLNGMTKLKEGSSCKIDILTDPMLWAFYITKQQYIMQTPPIYNNTMMIVPIGTQDYEEMYGLFGNYKKAESTKQPCITQKAKPFHLERIRTGRESGHANAEQ